MLVQLLEKEKASSSGIFLVVLYDDLFRRQLARRALAGEPELDINKCFQSRDAILEAARVRLTSVLVSAGLVPAPTSLATTSFSSGGPDVDIENSLLAKSHAAADAIQKKAAAAAKSLEHTQAELANANQTRAWLVQTASSQKGSGEGKGALVISNLHKANSRKSIGRR